MTRMWTRRRQALRNRAAVGGALALLGAWLAAGVASAQPLTADRAVQMALQRSSQVAGARAGVLEARGGYWGAAAGVLPRLSISVSRNASFIDNSTGGRFAGGQFVTGISDVETYTTDPSLSATWSVLNLSSITDFLAARTGLGAARLRETAARNDVALATRRQFYEVVRAIRLGDVAVGALRLARDDERRVRALFEVGSVARSDLLRAQVRRAQSELDSLTASQSVAVQRILLANQIGMSEPELGEVDTVLAAEPRSFEPGALVAEAERSRPDLQAAEAEVRSAEGSHRAARFARLPSLSARGSLGLNSTFDQKTTSAGTVTSFFQDNEREWSGALSVDWNVFDLLTDSRIASARGRMIRARDARDLLRRDITHQVQQALLDYNVALERNRVAQSAVASATENLNLTQQKYNVGSATILDLIDAQVQLQRARSDEVSALAAIHVAEAQIDRVRGRSE